MNDAINALAPCPFCGGPANFYENQIDFVPKWSVSCGGCDANMDVCEDEKADAATAWNTRALRPEPSPADALSPATEVRRELPRPWSYAYRYHDCIRMNNGCEVNGAKPIEALGLYLESDVRAILALPVGEAAIRADEREKQREIDAKIADEEYRKQEAEAMSDGAHAAWLIQRAIRNGGKQP